MGFTLAEICGQNMLVLPRIFRFFGIDLFTVFSTFDMDKFGKIHRHHQKSVLKLIKRLSLKANEDTAPQSHEALQTFGYLIFDLKNSIKLVVSRGVLLTFNS